MSVVELNEAVLPDVEEHALTPEAIEQVIHLSERDDVRETQEKLTRERKDVEKRISRLIAAGVRYPGIGGDGGGLGSAGESGDRA